VLARRQPGSTLKPFVYAQALTQGLVTEQSLLLDSPLQLARGQDVYQPQNFDHAWRGWVTLREALGASLNVPAVRVGAMLGPEAMFEAFNKAGLRVRESAGFHGHALALGSAEVSLFDLTNAYRALANQGQWRPPNQALMSNVNGQRSTAIMSPAVAATITSILSDSSARASTFGFDSPLVTRRATAAKTGTSKDMRDNWCLGYSGHYTVGVWLGNASGQPMHGVSGVVGAAPVWRQVIESLPGPGVAVLTPAAKTATPLASQTAWGIHPVRDGSVLAIDPDISPRAQQLQLRGPHGQWVMDGRDIGTGSSVMWPLAAGRHVLELRTTQRALIDKVSFEVRASSARPRQTARVTAPGG
jgi:penicillin-binding protein 1C